MTKAEHMCTYIPRTPRSYIHRSEPSTHIPDVAMTGQNIEYAVKSRKSLFLGKADNALGSFKNRILLFL